MSALLSLISSLAGPGLKVNAQAAFGQAEGGIQVAEILTRDAHDPVSVNCGKGGSGDAGIENESVGGVGFEEKASLLLDAVTVAV